jgi:hypothetical protein
MASGERPDSNEWMPAHIGDGYIFWRKPTEQKRYNNIATGASITGAARAYLLQGLKHAIRPVYCDTDSILCESLSGVPIDPVQLGAWKCECACTRAIVVGKKLYALFDADGNCIKQANKGSKLTANEIERIAQGETVTWRNPVPSFSMSGKSRFIQRRIRRTA